MAKVLVAQRPACGNLDRTMIQTEESKAEPFQRVTPDSYLISQFYRHLVGINMSDITFLRPVLRPNPQEDIRNW